MNTMKQSHSPRIDRIEPPCWWVGMKTPLQLMLHGNDLREAEVSIKGENRDVRISGVHPADSPNYLFVDIEIGQNARPGLYEFELKRAGETLSFSYPLQERRPGSAERTGFSAADLIYLIFPDRFSNGRPEIDNTPDTYEKVDRKKPYARHGGDLYGVMDHLDYFVSLGVTTLWLTPPQLDNEKKNPTMDMPVQITTGSIPG